MPWYLSVNSEIISRPASSASWTMVVTFVVVLSCIRSIVWILRVMFWLKVDSVERGSSNHMPVGQHILPLTARCVLNLDEAS